QESSARQSSSSSLTSSAASSTSSAGDTLTVTGFIVVDQFGYLPDAKKIAVIRDPQTGYDEHLSFTPGATLSLVNMTSGETVFTAAPAPWHSGATDTVS